MGSHLRIDPSEYDTPIDCQAHLPIKIQEAGSSSLKRNLSLKKRDPLRNLSLKEILL